MTCAATRPSSSPHRKPRPRRARGASRSSVSWRPSPAAVRPPRRPWRSGAPTARSFRDAASWPSPPAIACRTAPTRSAWRHVTSRAAFAATASASPASARPRSPTSRTFKPTPESPSSSRRWPGSTATARPSWRVNSPSSRVSSRPRGQPSANGQRTSSERVQRASRPASGSSRLARSSGTPSGLSRPRAVRRRGSAASSLRATSSYAARPRLRAAPPCWPTSSTSIRGTSSRSPRRSTGGFAPRSSGTGSPPGRCSTAPAPTAAGP